MSKVKRHKSGLIRKHFKFNGKRVDVYGKTEQECFEKLIKKRDELEKGFETIYNPTLDEYYKHFTDVRRTEVKESTLRSQRVQYDLISGVELSKGIRFGSMHIKDITRRNIEDARQILLRSGKTPQYLNNVFSHLNHVLNSATIDETIDKNPCKALKQLKRDDKPLITETKHRALTVDETIRFFKAARDRNSYYLNVFLFAIKSGMRIGEICALYPTDIDKHNGFVHVRRTITRDEVGQYIVGKDAKTDSGKRDIPLTDELIEIIRDQEYNNRVMFGLSKDGLIFRSVEGNILREYTVNREIKRICKDAGIDCFATHCFRDTFATRFIEQRPQDFKILSEILGHKDISITLNLYTHVMTENKISAMNDVYIKIG